VRRRARLQFAARHDAAPGAEDSGQAGSTSSGGPRSPEPARSRRPSERGATVATPELPGNFGGTRPHLTEHLQVVLVLVQVQHVGGQQRGGAAAAGPRGAVFPRAPGREPRAARRRCPALAVHPDSARPAGGRRGPAPRARPLAPARPAPPRARPRQPPRAAQTRNRRAAEAPGLRASPPGPPPPGSLPGRGCPLTHPARWGWVKDSHQAVAGGSTAGWKAADPARQLTKPILDFL
jgi:hypothetical protein